MAENHLSWLEKSIVFKCKHGSHAYGTNIEGSDIDIRGICIPPKEYYLGMKRFNQTEIKDGERDIAIFELRRFVELALKSNPNIFEVLFVDEKDIELMDDCIKPLFEARESFLSKRARYTFFGYADSQLKRIESHRSWILNPPNKKPERSDYGLPERSLIPKEEYELVNSQIRKAIDSFELNLQDLDDAERIEINQNVKNQLRNAGVSAEGIIEMLSCFRSNDKSLLETLVTKREYRKALQHWNQYMSFIENRNKKRRELEIKCGYDSKHAGHLIRLLRMANEILCGGKVLVKRPDAEEIKEIRVGNWSYEKLMQEVERQKSLIDKNYEESKLPKRPNMDKVEKIVVEIIEKRLRSVNQ